MKRSIRLATTLALVAIALCLGGCELRSLRIGISDFHSHQVGGVWVYQLSEASGEFEKTVQLAFTEPFDKEGTEVIIYTTDGLVDDEGNPVRLETQVVRSPENSDEVTLDLWFLGTPPIVIKVSAYNAIGESPLSDEILYL